MVLGIRPVKSYWIKKRKGSTHILKGPTGLTHCWWAKHHHHHQTRVCTNVEQARAFRVSWIGSSLFRSYSTKLSSSWPLPTKVWFLRRAFDAYALSRWFNKEVSDEIWAALSCFDEKTYFQKIICMQLVELMIITSNVDIYVLALLISWLSGGPFKRWHFQYFYMLIDSILRSIRSSPNGLIRLWRATRWSHLQLTKKPTDHIGFRQPNQTVDSVGLLYMGTSKSSLWIPTSHRWTWLLRNASIPVDFICQD